MNLKVFLIMKQNNILIKNILQLLEDSARKYPDNKEGNFKLHPTDKFNDNRNQIILFQLILHPF